MTTARTPERWLAPDAAPIVIAACAPLALLVADATAAVVLLELGGALATR